MSRARNWPSRIKYGSICSNASALHAVHDLARKLWVRDDENRLGIRLPEESIGDCDHVRTTLCACVPDDGVRVGSEHCIDDSLAVGDFWIRRRPEHPAWSDVSRHQRKSGPDTGASGDDDDLLEELRGVQQSVERVATDPEPVWRLHDG